MAVVKRYWTVGDTLTPLGAQLKASSSTGGYAVVDLTGLTVKFKMVNSSGTVVVAETTAKVTVISATDGTVTFDFSSSHVATAGDYYAWFKTYSGTEVDTYPVDGRKFHLVIMASA